MSEVEVHVLEIAVSVIIAAGSALVWFCFSINTRMTALEIYIKTSIKGAAEILHAADNWHGGDKRLEELVRAYEQQNFDLSLKEWQELADLTKSIMENESVPKGERLAASQIYSLAAMSHSLARHKLMRFLK